jgi:hypothetical protein
MNADIPHGSVTVFKTLFSHIERMLDDMESDLDKASTRLDIVTAKTRELIKRSGGVKYFLIIVVLTLVMLFLFFLVIYF